MIEVGLSFAGGGLKSFAHVALTQDLERHQVPIKAVAGTSMGSVLASLYAVGFRGLDFEMKLLEIERLFKKEKILLKPTLRVLPFVKNRSDGLIEQGNFEGFVKNVFDELGITMLSEVEMPLCIVTTELNSGDIILFSNKKEYFTNVGENCRFYEGDIELSKAVAASCAFPLVFQSVELEDLRLIDGGVRLNSPGEVFNRNKIKKVVSVTTMYADDEVKEYSMLDVAFRSVYIMMFHLEKISLKDTDIHVNFPVETKLMFEVGKGPEVINQAKEYLVEHPIDYSVLEEKNLRNLWGLLK